MAEKESNSSGKIAQLEQVVAAALRPLPTQTGDGSYVQEPTVTGLAKDLLNFDLKDAKTLADMAKTAVTGKAVNDRDYIMERVIQVCVSARNWPSSHSNSSAACFWLAFDISKWQGADQYLPHPVVG
jgi:membrane-associated phospholipid phosphatase